MNYLDAAIEVIKILNDNSFDAYIVGGFVRDYILNIESNDIDLTSNATPEEVSKIFEIIPTGIKYGTVLIDYKGFKFEHTTFRLDGSYSDSRHPKEVVYAKNVMDDLVRRDFTINSLLMNSNKEVIDKLDGIKDLKSHLIKTIGNPDLRFKEDALRILRVFSFVSKLGFDIDKETYLSIKKNKDLLKNVSVERIRIELDKISNGLNRSKAWELFYELKINEVFPNMLLVKDFDVTFRDILIHSELNNSKIDAFWQISKNDVKQIEKASKMIKEGLTDYSLFINGYVASTYALNYLKLDLSLWDNLVIKSLKDLNIKGNELSFIVKEKRSLCLNYLAKLVIENKLENNKEKLLEEAKKWNILQ